MNRNEIADFETAIAATGFGKFNFLLILIAFPAGWASFFATTTMSYVFPVAQCDLDLSLNDKGLLNAVTYAGTISSGLIWAFLIDTLGRKKFLTVGYFLDFVFVILSALSQNKTMLMVAKLCQGIMISGPIAAFTSYLAEFHSTKNRPRMQLVLGFIYAMAGIALPFLAWLIISRDFHWTLHNFEFYSWNLYLVVCSLPSLLASVIFCTMPESPKFLMSTGQNQKALEIFRKIYRINGNTDDFPIKELKEEVVIKDDESQLKRSNLEALKSGFSQMKPLFYAPHFKHVLFTCTLQMLITMNLNTLRLWFPQIFLTLSEYELANGNETSSVELCDIIEVMQPSDNHKECVVNSADPFIYVNSLIVSTVSMFVYFATGCIINKLGKKRLIFLYCVISGSSAIAFYFAKDTLYILLVASLFSASSSVSTNVVLSVIIDLFPTSMRTMTISLSMMMARVCSIIGNVLFPILITLGCLPPFFFIATVLFGCAILIIFLPNTDLKALQ